MPSDKQSLPPGIRDEALRTQTNPIVKDEVYFEKYGAETNGKYARLRIGVGPSGGVPLHYHNSYAEFFTAKKGDLAVEIDGKTTILKPGETREVPKGTKHRFFNPSKDEKIEMEVVMRPAHEGFEKSLYITYGLARDGLVNEKGLPSFVPLCIIATMGDMQFPGLLMAMGMPAIRLVAAWARWRGEEERLLRKYWY